MSFTKFILLTSILWIPCWVIGYLSDLYYYLVCLLEAVFRVIFKVLLLYFCQSFNWGDSSISMKLKEDLDNNDNAGDKNNIQKQVKQKLLQAQQEEALFVKTSAALQNKMEKVEQQLSHSMNGYHLGIHLKKDLEQNKSNSANPKCPMLDGSANKQQQQTNQIKKSTDEDIASSYFQVWIAITYSMITYMHHASRAVPFHDFTLFVVLSLFTGGSLNTYCLRLENHPWKERTTNNAKS